MVTIKNIKNIYHFRPVTPNIGNDLIVMALHQLVSNLKPNTYNIINLPAKGVHATIKTGGINKNNVHDINQMGSGVLIGPGNFFENNGLDIDMNALHALQIPSLIFSVSWGRIYDDAGNLHPRTDAMRKDVIQALCTKTYSVLVRDEPTKEFLENLGITNTKVIGCPALIIEPQKLNLQPINKSLSGTVLISVRNPTLMNISPRLQGRIYSDIHRIINSLNKMGHQKIAILCHDFRDIRFAQTYSGIPILYTEDPFQYLSWLRDCKLNITFRLHSLLPCAVLETPAIHFSYDERAMGLIATSKLKSCDVNYVTNSDPITKAMDLCASPEKLIQAMKSAKPHWIPLRNIMANELTKWLNKLE